MCCGRRVNITAAASTHTHTSFFPPQVTHLPKSETAIRALMISERERERSAYSANFSRNKNPMHVNNVRIFRCWNFFRRQSVSFLLLLFDAFRFDSFHLCVSFRVWIFLSSWLLLSILWTFAAGTLSSKSRLGWQRTSSYSRIKTSAFDFHCVFSKQRNLCNLLWYSFVGIIPNNRKEKRISFGAHRRRFIDCSSWFACNKNRKEKHTKEKKKKTYTQPQ